MVPTPFLSITVRNTAGLYEQPCLIFLSVPTCRNTVEIEKDSNLVDPASSHTLVSKIKPCMSKYKHFIL